VLIPTYGRYESLLKTLNSLLRQSYSDYEILLIDQNKEMKKEALDLIERNAGKVRRIKVDYIGGTRARNEGLLLAQGEIIICCDDDIEAGEDFIENHAKNYTDPRVGGVAGGVVTGHDTPVFSRQKVGVIRKLDGKVISNFNAGFRIEVEHAWGCNMSFLRRLLIEAGGFDERLEGTQSFLEPQVCFSIRRLGYKIVFDPTARARHLHASAGGCRGMDFPEMMFWYYHNFMIFYLTHMGKIFFPIFLTRQIAGIFRRAIVTKDFKVIFSGMKGLVRGFADYFNKGAILRGAGRQA